MRTARWINKVWRRHEFRLMTRNARWVAETWEIPPLWTDWIDPHDAPPRWHRRRSSAG
jgi:hypothetical protein